MHVVNLTRDADIPAVLGALRKIGAVSQPYPKVPRLVHVEGGTHAQIEAVPGVLSCCDGEDEVRLAYVKEPRNVGLSMIAGGGNYVYETDGTGVAVYIVDTGVQPQAEFPRLTRIHDGFPGEPLFWHGTCVASAAAGQVYGAAPGADIFDARVFGAGGTASPVSAILDGLAAVLDHMTGPAVVNMSLAGDTAFGDAMLDALHDAGAVLIAAAGNDGRDVTGRPAWPAAHEHVLSVGALTADGEPTGFSNFPADIWAMGDSDPLRGPDGEMVVRGTSFAAPLVAGAVARLLQGHAPLSGQEPIVGLLLALAEDGQLRLPPERVFSGLPMDFAAFTY